MIDSSPQWYLVCGAEKLNKYMLGSLFVFFNSLFYKTFTSKCYYLLDVREEKTRPETQMAPCLGYLSSHYIGRSFKPVSLCLHMHSCESVWLSIYYHISRCFQGIWLFSSFKKWENWGLEKWCSTSKVKFWAQLWWPQDPYSCAHSWQPSGEVLHMVSTCTVCSALIGEKTKCCPFGNGLIWQCNEEREWATCIIQYGSHQLHVVL